MNTRTISIKSDDARRANELRSAASRLERGERDRAAEQAARVVRELEREKAK